MNLLLSEDRQPVISPKKFAIQFAKCANIEALLDLESVSMIERIAETAPLGSSKYHGFRHWLTVLSNGMAIIDHTPEIKSNAFRLIMTLFALFHDVRRETEGHCNQHGKMASLYLTRGLPLDIDSWLRLKFGNHCLLLAAHACELHTICEVPFKSPLLRVGTDAPIGGLLSEESSLILGACLDADRLDLGRVGIIPDPFYLFTRAARQHAALSIHSL